MQGAVTAIVPINSDKVEIVYHLTGGYVKRKAVFGLAAVVTRDLDTGFDETQIVPLIISGGSFRGPDSIKQIDGREVQRWEVHPSGGN